MVFSKFLEVASQIPDIKKTEIVCHIARKTAYVTPLLTGDDLSLRTTLTSPANYDRELAQLLHRHTEFHEEGENKQYPFLQFCQQLSNLDRIALLWAMYKATYDDLDTNREITCENENCKNPTFYKHITMDDLIHNDTFYPWEETNENGDIVPFTEYRYTINVNYDEDVYYQFSTKVPTIQDNNQMIGMLSVDALQYNLQNIGSVFSRPQQITLIADGIRIGSKSGTFEMVETTDKNEILHALDSYIPNSVSKSMLKEYNKKFNKYEPRFYKEVDCPSCGYKFNYTVDLELEFFWRSVFSGEES